MYKARGKVMQPKCCSLDIGLEHIGPINRPTVKTFQRNLQNELKVCSSDILVS